MIINSQFFITYYTGNEKLPLKQMPTNLNVEQKAEYLRFIQSIGSIYSSQNINGKIPKFWTRLVEGTDALGNRTFYYTAHPDSDLEFLESKSAYYFIVRDESSIPLRIPSIGGSLLGFTDTKLLPNVIPSTIPAIALTATSGNSIVINPQIDNLQPYEEYKYEFKSVNANWPVSINAISGILKPSTPTGSVRARVVFCPTSGSCDTNTVNYTLPQVCLSTQDTDKYAILQLSIKPTSYDGPEILSNQFNIICTDCLPKPTVVLSGTTTNSLIIRPQNSMEYLSYNIVLSTSNLLLDQKYNFNIEVTDAQWPITFVGASSGTVSPNRSYYGKIVFCPATGVCQPGQNGIINYQLPSYPKFWSGDRDYDVVLRASLSSNTCPEQIVYSNPLVITYRQPAIVGNDDSNATIIVN